MTRWLSYAAGVVAVTGAAAFFAYGQGPSPQRSPVANPAAVSEQRALIDQYCVTCHNDRTKRGNLSLEKQNLARVAENAELWERVIRKLRAGMMPPVGARRPETGRLDAMTTWLENEIDRVALSRPALVRPGIHRLNRAEYANAIRDVLGLEIDASKFLPVDDSEQGFDNVASSLKMSAALMEGYVSAAGKLSRMALGRETLPGQWTYNAPQDLSQEEHIEGMPLGTRGGILVRHFFPADGEYAFTFAPVRGNTGQLFGHLRPDEQLEIAIDGTRIKLVRWGDLEDGIDDDDLKNIFRTPVKAGMRTVTAAFLATTHVPIDDLNRHPQRSVVDTTPLAGFTWSPQLSRITIMGPYEGMNASDLPSRRKIFVCTPQSVSLEAACARQILSTLARAAYRRPSTDEDMESIMEFFEAGKQNGGFEDGIELGIRRILADPEFVFRTEPEPANVKPGQTYRIRDLDLAARLSFFLWSTRPDDELINLAAQGKLSDPSVLQKQVLRMLADPRSSELVENFAGQWLQLRNLASTSPLVHVFPNFDDNLRQAYRREVELFFESIVREDRSVVDLLAANYTFVNDRLARQYGIANIYGSHFRRVTLPPELDARRGLLGKGAIHLLTSLPDRTSPVQRGKWVLMNVLGTIPPEPPPNVPELKKSTKTANGQEVALEVPMRKRMEEHRTNPACAGCHRIMDPIGFALENFDAVGSFRTVEFGERLDVSDQLVDGTPISGPAGLRQAMTKYSPQFVRTLTEKLMVYALGRSVQYYDMPVVRAIVRDAARDQYRFSSIVLGIVKSAPFQMGRKEEQAAAR
jgi:mono/diheme cytochrome c family protein